MYQDIILM